MKKWKLLKSEIVLDNKWFRVHKDKVGLPSGKIIDDYYVWDEDHVAQVVVLTKNNEIVLEKQYKHGYGDFVIECPAGYVEKGESFEDAAKREVLEETGYSSNDELIPLGKITHNPTKSSGLVKLFLMTNAKRVRTPKLDETEDIEIFTKPIIEVVKMIDKGEIYSSGTISAIFLAISKLKYTKFKK